jgi:hypothetical protein
MTLMCGSNYLLLRHQLDANHAGALLHLLYYADEMVGNGWTDRREDQQPKTWATALGLLTLHRWAHDLGRTSTPLPRIPTRAELLKKLQPGSAVEGRMSSYARSLVRRFKEVRPGPQHARKYQVLVRDVFAFLFGDVLKDPKLESKTIYGTLRRDVMFSNAAEVGSGAIGSMNTTFFQL